MRREGASMLAADIHGQAASVPAAAGSLGRDLCRLVTHPSALFSDLPRYNRSTGALGVLLALHVLYALALLGTGVIDYEIDAETQRQVARAAQRQEGEEKADQLLATLDTLEKGGAFQKVLARVLLGLGGPAGLLLGIGLVAGLLFVAVALQGGKPNFPVLAGVVIFASYVEVPRLLLRVALVAQLHASRVETSAAAFVVRPDVGLPAYVLLRRLDPFALWYWWLVGLGVWKAGQMRLRPAIVVVVGLAVLAGLWASALDVLELAELTPPAEPAP